MKILHVYDFEKIKNQKLNMSKFGFNDYSLKRQ